MSVERDHGDFVALREATVLVLLDEDQGGKVDLDMLRAAVARSEWGRVDPDRRFWALGHCAGDAAAFDEVREVVHLGWDQLSPAIQDSLTSRVLDWIRAAVAHANNQPSEIQVASEGTAPSEWDVETNIM